MKALQGWVAAVAVLVFGQVTGERVWAEIVYSGPDRNVTYSSSGDVGVFSLFGSEGTWDDIALEASWIDSDGVSGSNGMYVKFWSMMQVYGNYVDFAEDGISVVKNFAEGAVIDSSASFESDVDLDFARYEERYDPPSLYTNGEFLNTTGYAGIRLTNGTEIYYGWIQFAVANYDNPNVTGTLIDWAYNDTPGQAIQAGAVPEPSTLALLGAGLAGGAALLRRRSRL